MFVCVPRLSCGIAFRRRLCRRPRSHLDPCTYLAPSSHSSHNKSCSLAHLTTRIVVAVADADVVVAGGAAAASLQFRCCCCCCELLLKKNYNVDKLKADRLGGGGRDRALEQCETRTQTLKWPLSASSCGPRNATPCHAKPSQAMPHHVALLCTAAIELRSSLLPFQKLLTQPLGTSNIFEREERRRSKRAGDCLSGTLFLKNLRNFVY